MPGVAVSAGLGQACVLLAGGITPVPLAIASGFAVRQTGLLAGDGVAFPALFYCGAMKFHRMVPKAFPLTTSIGTSMAVITASAALVPAMTSPSFDISHFDLPAIIVSAVLAVLIYPQISQSVFKRSTELSGMFLGTSIHDTTQMFQSSVDRRCNKSDNVAVHSKSSSKFSLLAGIIPGIAVAGVRAQATSRKAVSMVVAGFIGMVGLRSVGDAWLPEDNPYWNRVVSFVTKDASQTLLATASAAVGLSISGTIARQLALLLSNEHELEFETNDCRAYSKPTVTVASKC
ncbi:unnamed protein product (mitochondrion) [Plasmodiophora brassicae]|uniref:Uncharacterized protein n=1 Tax=Plasmodiophora brassicae TaxID=37360 RepID=A0A3P3YLT0_PLABS|nr:unnamed protein product [Plasmodiophora brassicae]